MPTFRSTYTKITLEGLIQLRNKFAEKSYKELLLKLHTKASIGQSDCYITFSSDLIVPENPDKEKIIDLLLADGFIVKRHSTNSNGSCPHAITVSGW